MAEHEEVEGKDGEVYRERPHDETEHSCQEVILDLNLRWSCDAWLSCDVHMMSHDRCSHELK